MYINHWTSYHIFLHDFKQHDPFLKKVLIPYLEKETLIKGFYYMRYWQGGPHIRLRVKTTEISTVLKKLQQLVYEFRLSNPLETTLTADVFYKNHQFDGQQPTPSMLYWKKDATVCIIPYTPEFERYGNELLMPYSEAIFQHSTYLASTFIKFVPDNHLLLKIWFSKLTMKKFLASYPTNWQEELLTKYETFWSSYHSGIVKYEIIECSLEQVEKRLSKYKSSFERMSEVYEQEIQRLLRLISQDVDPIVFQYICISHIHMLHNRIGLPPEFEAFIAYLNMHTKGGIYK